MMWHHRYGKSHYYSSDFQRSDTDCSSSSHNYQKNSTSQPNFLYYQRQCRHLPKSATQHPLIHISLCQYRTTDSDWVPTQILLAALQMSVRYHRIQSAELDSCQICSTFRQQNRCVLRRQCIVEVPRQSGGSWHGTASPADRRLCATMTLGTDARRTVLAQVSAFAGGSRAWRDESRHCLLAVRHPSGWCSVASAGLIWLMCGQRPVMAAKQGIKHKRRSYNMTNQKLFANYILTHKNLILCRLEW